MGGFDELSVHTDVHDGMATQLGFIVVFGVVTYVVVGVRQALGNGGEFWLHQDGEQAWPVPGGRPAASSG